MSHSVVEEATIKTLAVMTKADTNINEVEVAVVQQVLKDELGLDLTSADVRVAAHDEFIEGRAISKYLKKVRKDLSLADKKRIMRSLVKVVKADNRTSDGEKAMFNEVAKALELSAADLVSL